MEFSRCKYCSREMKPGNGCRYTHYHRGKKYYERVVCSQDVCHDCNASKGQPHHPGCDMERCPICGRQFIICEHLKTATLSIKPKPDIVKAPWRYEKHAGGLAVIGKNGTWIAELQDTALASVDPANALDRAVLISSAPDLADFVLELSQLPMMDLFDPRQTALRKKAQMLIKRLHSDYYRRKS